MVLTLTKQPFKIAKTKQDMFRVKRIMAEAKKLGLTVTESLETA